MVGGRSRVEGGRTSGSSSGPDPEPESRAVVHKVVATQVGGS